MIGLDLVYPFAGLIFLAFAGSALRDRSHRKRIGNALFYALIALSLLAGDRLGDLGNGVLVLGLVAIAGFGLMGRGNAATTSPVERAAEAAARRNRLFLPALAIPATALAGTLAFKQMPALVDPKQATLVALTLGVTIALAIGYAWLRPRAMTPFDEGRRLMDGVGWAAALPQMLASLGAVFALAGVGDVVGGLMGRLIPEGSLFGAVLAYALGMALFTIVMGNAFAAFPVMIAAVGIPVLIHGAGGDPAIVAAIGMLAGFCGTLMTPMAANFNLVPAALLDLKDRHGVIRAQIPTALPLLAVNIGLLYWLAFR
ncbi:DUF979 family protein [Sphingomonas histidinilytica]|uniref:Uncharacterized membrane protein n=1 Tax=Rhizorhabdus histidinilytica TaxID=439228 RepID=A0A1T5FGM4_9SPHN|nr:DUF979 domain-containing protein [Rhizorhabdus histidinilytica]MBO9375649.1 DUF979 family protein [Rhizorhabdus histidinilytica]SKB95315.1 Uncharacterized membrane protein [Rhizorhabdus histidinilytica]